MVVLDNVKISGETNWILFHTFSLYNVDLKFQTSKRAFSVILVRIKLRITNIKLKIAIKLKNTGFYGDFSAF